MCMTKYFTVTLRDFCLPLPPSHRYTITHCSGSTSRSATASASVTVFVSESQTVAVIITCSCTEYTNHLLVYYYETGQQPVA